MINLVGKKIVATMVFSCVIGVAMSVNADDSRITINYAHCCAPDQAYGVYGHTFADLVKEKSNGEIKVEVLDGGVMGSEQAIAQKVQMGVVQMAGVTVNNVAQLAPSLNIYVLPYLFDNIDELTGDGGLLRSGPYRDELNSRVLRESGSLMMVGGYTNYFRTLFMKDKVVDSIDDLAKLKIRVPKNPVMTAMWNSWGVSTYPIAWGETYGAISQGVVDAFDTGIDVILKAGYYEHIKQATEFSYLPLAAAVIVNNDWFQNLSTEDQEIIKKSAAETDEFHAKWVKESVESNRESLITDHGVTFHKLTDDGEWKKRAQSTWPKLYRLVGGKEWVEKTTGYLDTGTM